MSTLTDFDINLTRYLQMSILEEHAADLKDDAARKKYMTDRARTMVASQWISKLYAPYYLPEEAEALGPQPAVLDEKWIDLYKKYGFYWPTEADLVQLAMENPDFNMSDLVVEQVRWKSNSCGFSYIQLVFRKGITSPIFQTESDKEKGEDFTTTSVRNAGNVRYIRARTHEEKYVEKLQFYSENIPADQPVPKEKLHADIAPCRCGEDQVIELKPGHRLVGLYGISSTDKFCWDEKIRHLDQIRALGFITMNVQY